MLFFFKYSNISTHINKCRRLNVSLIIRLKPCSAKGIERMKQASRDQCWGLQSKLTTTSDDSNYFKNTTFADGKTVELIRSKTTVEFGIYFKNDGNSSYLSSYFHDVIAQIGIVETNIYKFSPDLYYKANIRYFIVGYEVDPDLVVNHERSRKPLKPEQVC